MDKKNKGSFYKRIAVILSVFVLIVSLVGYGNAYALNSEESVGVLKEQTKNAEKKEAKQNEETEQQKKHQEGEEVKQKKNQKQNRTAEQRKSLEQDKKNKGSQTNTKQKAEEEGKLSSYNPDRLSAAEISGRVTTAKGLLRNRQPLTSFYEMNCK